MGDNRDNSDDSSMHLCRPKIPTACPIRSCRSTTWSARCSCCSGHSRGSTSSTARPTSRRPAARDRLVGLRCHQRRLQRTVSRLPSGATVRRDAGLYGYERALRRVGMDLVAGVDEAGRGACAGPLVAGAARPQARQGRRDPRPGRLQAAHREGAGALLRPGRDAARWPGRSWSSRPRVRPARHARGEHRGPPPGGGAARRAAAVRPHRRLPRRRSRRPGAGGVEGRPGGGVHRGRVRPGQGDP